MSANRSVWFILAVFTILVSSCMCLECFDCAAKDDPICLDPFSEVANADGTSECGPKDTHCIKFKTVSFLADSGFITGKDRVATVVSRMCVRRDGYSDGCVALESDGGFLFTCLCSTDFCNSAIATLPNMVVLMVAVLVSLWMSKR